MIALHPRPIFTLLVMLGLLTASSAFGQETGTKVYLGGMRSAVQVLVPVGRDGYMLGSGSVINLKQGYILTNWHVVREGREAAVLFPLWDKGRPVVEADKYERSIAKVTFRAKIIASDERCDLAIIKLSDPARMPKGTSSVRFAADSPQAGAKIYSIGNPVASDAMWVYTPGEVRNVYTKKWQSSSGGKLLGDHSAKIIEATSPTSPGDSGGPCFNERGEQVGVTQGGLNVRVAQGFSYFIDSSDIKAFLKKNKIDFNVVNDVLPETQDPDPMTAKNPDPKPGPAVKKEPVVDDNAKKMEKDAASRLNFIRPLAKDPNKRTSAIEQLQKLITMFPKTDAAKEAQALLKQLQQ